MGPGVFKYLLCIRLYLKMLTMKTIYIKKYQVGKKRHVSGNQLNLPILTPWPWLYKVHHFLQISSSLCSINVSLPDIFYFIIYSSSILQYKLYLQVQNVLSKSTFKVRFNPSKGFLDPPPSPSKNVNNFFLSISMHVKTFWDSFLEKDFCTSPPPLSIK